jgi:hypothetical protein
MALENEEKSGSKWISLWQLAGPILVNIARFAATLAHLLRGSYLAPD